jgi:thiamine-phosphate pyrophosphorylase
MSAAPVLYYITDRTAFPGDEARRRLHLLLKIAEAARAGVDYVQLREKDLSTREFEWLARDALKVIHEHPGHHTRLLINSRTDIALAVGADGVHLRAHDLSPTEIRQIVHTYEATGGASTAGLASRFLIGVSCHTAEEVSKAAASGADFAVFAPVFEKKDAPATQPAGTTALRAACRTSIPVLALGGISLQNARACLDAGASGIAAIRLFQENDLATLIPRLRAL